MSANPEEITNAQIMAAIAGMRAGMVAELRAGIIADMRAENIAMEQTFSAKLDEMETRTSAEIKEVKGSIGEVEGNITMLQNEVDKNEDILQRVSESRTATTATRSIPRNSLLFSQIVTRRV
jgi:uncharacterized small protein (DUF1192 family)